MWASPLRIEWRVDLVLACDQAGDQPGLQTASARLASLDAAQAKALAKELKRSPVRRKG